MTRLAAGLGKWAMVAGVIGMLASPAMARAATTLENMQAAYNGESNAHARYLEFAKQANKEGYGEVASLFRAAARAEEIHAANHAAVIRKVGQDPQAKIENPDVKSTRENLEAAIKGESYERDTMYPDFLKQARLDNNKEAIKSLNYAKQAEEEHAKLFKSVLSRLDKLKGTSADVYYVCPTCGFTTHDYAKTECPTCFTHKERFEQIS